jgi:hypothetical protein
MSECLTKPIYTTKSKYIVAHVIHREINKGGNEIKEYGFKNTGGGK